MFARLGSYCLPMFTQGSGFISQAVGTSQIIIRDDSVLLLAAVVIKCVLADAFGDS